MKNIDWEALIPQWLTFLGVVIALLVAGFMFSKMTSCIQHSKALNAQRAKEEAKICRSSSKVVTKSAHYSWEREVVCSPKAKVETEKLGSGKVLVKCICP